MSQPNQWRPLLAYAICSRGLLTGLHPPKVLQMTLANHERSLSAGRGVLHCLIGQQIGDRGPPFQFFARKQLVRIR